MEQKKLQQLKQKLEKRKNIVIIPHWNPDGDAIGSTLAMYLYLKEKHNVRLISPNVFPTFLSWMPNASDIMYFERQKDTSKRKIRNADLIFLMDFNALHRTGNDMAHELESFKGDFVMIDHHQEPDALTEFMYSDTSICSTCQMVYHFFEMMGETSKITKDIATCLYTGIMTDTGSFRFRSTTSTTHKIVAELIDLGADNAEIHNQVYDTNSYNRLMLLGKALQNLKVIEGTNTAYITLTKDELNTYGYQKGDTEGIVNYALSLKGIMVAAIFIEDTERHIIKISFRSKGDFSVNTFARKYFEGGGHTNAAGGKSDLNFPDTLVRFEKLIKEHFNEKEQTNVL